MTELLDQHGGVEGITRKLASDMNSGIVGDERDLERRAKMFGKNKMPSPPNASWLISLKQVGKEVSWWVAIITALLAVIGGWISAGNIAGTLEGLGLLLFICMIMAIIATVDYFKDNRFIQLLQLLKSENMSVIRGKAFQTRSISVWDLVVGDVVLLEAGSRVPADCLIMEQENLRISYEPASSNATTEEEEPTRGRAASVDDVERSNDDKFLKAGSIVKSGTGKVLVCCVGANSTRGISEKKLNLDKDTALQVKLQNLRDYLTTGAILATVVILVEYAIVWIVRSATSENWFAAFLGDLLKLVNFFVIFAIASIPEGLPLVLQLSLAFSIMKMHEQDKVLVKDL